MQLIEENLEIHPKSVHAKLVVTIVKDEKHYVAICNSLLVTGYGSTKAEAFESLEICLEQFFSDFKDPAMLDAELNRLGWHAENHSFKIPTIPQGITIQKGFVENRNISKRIQLAR